jgi:hypothetical protein
MRDYRDAKAMAQTLRDALAAKHHKITVGESLELVARLFGVADWNTLSAIIKTSATSNNSDPGPAPTRARGGPGKVQFARTTEVTLQRTLALAVSRNQGEATVQHLLFALTDDPDAAAVMEACNATPAAIKEALHSSGEIGPAPGEYDDRQSFADPTPTPAFERVVQRAILDLQAAGGGDLTGAHLLAAILSEQAAVAVRILSEQGVSERAVLRIVTGRAE